MNSYLLDRTALSNRSMSSNLLKFAHAFDPLKPLRNWLENLNISNPQASAQAVSTDPIPMSLSSAISIYLGARSYIFPPMCKLNPLYEEVVMLRFKAMCYLADECGEDISQYC